MPNVWVNFLLLRFFGIETMIWWCLPHTTTTGTQVIEQSHACMCRVCVCVLCHRSTQKFCDEMMARACDLAVGIVDKKLFSTVILIRYYVPTSDWRQNPSSSTFSISQYIVPGDFHTLHKLTSWACALLNIYATTSHRRYEMRNHKILIFYMPFVLVLGLFHAHIEPILSWSSGGAVFCVWVRAQVDTRCVSMARLYVYMVYLHGFARGPTTVHLLYVRSYVPSINCNILFHRICRSSVMEIIFAIHTFRK